MYNLLTVCDAAYCGTSPVIFHFTQLIPMFPSKHTVLRSGTVNCTSATEWFVRTSAVLAHIVKHIEPMACTCENQSLTADLDSIRDRVLSEIEGTLVAGLCAVVHNVEDVDGAMTNGVLVLCTGPNRRSVRKT